MSGRRRDAVKMKRLMSDCRKGDGAFRAGDVNGAKIETRTARDVSVSAAVSSGARGGKHGVCARGLSDAVSTKLCDDLDIEQVFGTGGEPNISDTRTDTRDSHSPVVTVHREKESGEATVDAEHCLLLIPTQRLTSSESDIHKNRSTYFVNVKNKRCHSQISVTDRHAQL